MWVIKLMRNKWSEGKINSYRQLTQQTLENSKMATSQSNLKVTYWANIWCEIAETPTNVEC